MRRSTLVRLRSVALASALVAGSTNASAFPDDPRASALIEQGLDLRQAQRDVEALALFEQAQALAPSPRGQAQVALAQQALGRWLLAEKNLRPALATKDDPWIESRRPILEHAMTIIASHLGDVEVVGAKEGAVYVDGARVDDADAHTHLRLEVGRRNFELRAPGFYPFSRILDVLPGEVVRIEVEQHPLLQDRAAEASPNEGTMVPVAAPSPNAGRTQRIVGWAGLGVGGALLATGVIGLIDRDVAAGNFNASAACYGTNENMLSSTCNGWRSDGTTGETLAIVGFVGGGVVTAASAVLLLTAPTRPKAAAFSVPCSPTRGGASCSFAITF